MPREVVAALGGFRGSEWNGHWNNTISLVRSRAQRANCALSYLRRTVQSPENLWMQHHCRRREPNKWFPLKAWSPFQTADRRACNAQILLVQSQWNNERNSSTLVSSNSQPDRLLADQALVSMPGTCRSLICLIRASCNIPFLCADFVAEPYQLLE